MEVQNLKRVKKQVVNTFIMKKFKFIVLVFVFLFLMVGYSFAQVKLIPTNNKGGYTVAFGDGQIKNKEETVDVFIRDGSSVTIRGHVYDVKTGEPLSHALLIDGCYKFLTTDEGEYSFRTRNLEGDSFNMEAAAMFYRSVDTNYINIYNKKEVIIDFYLVMDDRPFSECSGIGSERHKRMQEELNNLK